MRIEVETRCAVEEDIPALIDIAQRSWLSGNCELAPIEAVRDWMAGDWETKRFPEIWRKVTVAEHQSRPLGLASTDGREVADLWVHPSFQRRGVGSVLLQVCEAEIRNAGHSVARLLYTEFNVAAPLFYQAHGYTEVDRSRDTLPSGTIREVIVMEKQLGK